MDQDTVLEKERQQQQSDDLSAFPGDVISNSEYSGTTPHFVSANDGAIAIREHYRHGSIITTRTGFPASWHQLRVLGSYYSLRTFLKVEMESVGSVVESWR